MMNHEHEMSDPRGNNPFFTSLATFFSFLAFGAIPLLPFILFTTVTPTAAFLLSIAGTFSALVVLGLLKWRIVGSKLGTSLFEVVTIGGVAAVLAYMVGMFFSV